MRTVTMFKKSRKGLEFKGFKKIYDCDLWDSSFIRDTDESGESIPEQEQVLINGSGRVIMEEVSEALSTGIGCIGTIMDDEITYTTYAENLDYNEIAVMLNPGKGFYYTQNELEEALEQAGFTTEEIAVARYFEDWECLLDDKENGFNYIEREYWTFKEEPDIQAEADIFYYNNKFYIHV
jgi:hypothetical protein